MLARRFQRTGDPQHVGALVTADGLDVDQRHRAGRHRSGLVEHDRVHPSCGLEHLGTLDQETELSAAPGADEQRRRCRQAQRARAGDDQHGHGGAEGPLRVAGGEQPPDERGHGEPDHDRYEDRRDAIGEALDRCLARLRVLDQPGDLRQLGVGAHAGGAHDQPPVGVDGRAGHVVAGSDLDRNALARDERPVDRRRALEYDAIGGDLLARAHDEPIADGEFADRHPTLVAVVVEYGDILGTQVEQGTDGIAGPALGPRFEVAPGEDEGHDRRGDLEVDLGRVATAVHRHRLADRRRRR